MKKSPRKPASGESSRLKVLAAGSDDRAFLDYALTLLESGQRIQRETALEALVERPVAPARPILRELYFALSEDGLKRDQGGGQRSHIVRVLRSIGDTRDVDVALSACDTSEIAFGDDITRNLRALGLMMLAELDADIFPYYAIEHLDDADEERGSFEPASTAFQLLAGTGNYVPIYQWLRTTGLESGALGAVFELFAGAPSGIVQRYIGEAIDVSVRRSDERTCTLLAETVVRMELADAYPALERVMAAKISDELYRYMALLLASTNRRGLLEILELQLRRGRRPKMILEALRVRPTAEQQAMIERWERGDE